MVKQNAELKKRLTHIHAESSISDSKSLLSPLILPGTPSEKVDVCLMFSFVIENMILKSCNFVSAFIAKLFYLKSTFLQSLINWKISTRNSLLYCMTALGSCSHEKTLSVVFPMLDLQRSR